jgi:hypothetical protein
MSDSGGSSYDPLRGRVARDLPARMERAGARFGAHERDLGTPLPPRSVEPVEPDDLLEWQPAAGAGSLVGVSLIAVALLLALIALWQLRASSGALKGLWLLVGGAAVVGAGYTAYLLRGLGTLRYVFTSDALLVRWLGDELPVPYAELLDVVYRPRDAISLAARERFWPGYYISVVHRPEGLWRSYATESPGRRMRLVTSDGIVAISPHRPVLFRQELERRRARVPDAPSRPPITRLEPITAARTPARAPAAPPRSTRVDLPRERVAPGPVTPPRAAAPALRLNRALVDDIYHTHFRERLLGDQIASTAIALGVALPLLMAAYLFSQYEGVPRDVPLHWDAHGLLDRLGAPRELWLLPLTSVCILAVNTLLATFAIAFDRFAARLLTVATPIAQLATFFALARIVS